MSLGSFFDEPAGPPSAAITISDPAADADEVVQIKAGTSFRVAGRVRWTPSDNLFISKVRLFLFETGTNSGVTTHTELGRADAAIDSRIDASGEILWHGGLQAPKDADGRAVVRAVAVDLDENELARKDLVILLAR